MGEEEKKPKYKVGDVVTVKKRVWSSNDYQHGFIDRMASKCGKQFTIEMVSKGVPSRGIPDDGYDYQLEEFGYTWRSSMFEDTEVSATSCVYESSDDSDIDAFIRKKKCPELDFNL